MLQDPETPESEYALLDAASVRFLNHVKVHYTRDVAVDVMNALQPVLGKDWSGRLLFNLLSDTYKVGDSIRFTIPPHVAGYKKIQAIKVVRSLSGMGLSESKMLVESAENGVMRSFGLKPEALAEGVSWIENQLVDLRDAGALANYI